MKDNDTIIIFSLSSLLKVRPSIEQVLHAVNIDLCKLIDYILKSYPDTSDWDMQRQEDMITSVLNYIEDLWNDTYFTPGTEYFSSSATGEYKETRHLVTYTVRELVEIFTRNFLTINKETTHSITKWSLIGTMLYVQLAQIEEVSNDVL